VIYFIVIGFVIVISVIFQIYFLKRNQKVDGDILILTTNEGKKLFSLELDKSPEEMEKMKFIVFKVVKSEEEDLSQDKQ
jgi:hypothetical protein